ncbi:hypothetical protein OHT59_01300 [Streptomyces sp. NBC_00243]|nr:hypothetical protein [Streptomyces sp. NBC_00243]WRZ17216.1 hypothetical protein OHT59_01300 [Streptomyces sp. NBC_00243]
MFWRDLEIHHPGIDSLRLAPEVAQASKERLAYIRDTQGHPVRPRVNFRGELVFVRAFYQDTARWAADDPARWASWAAPCPIEANEYATKKCRSGVKSRMDQRTRTQLPLLPALLRAVDRQRKDTMARITAARATPAGGRFLVAGEEFERCRSGQARRVEALTSSVPEAFAGLAEVPARLNSLLADIAETVRSRFRGKITYASGTWEQVDWAPFDIVSADAYGDASDAFRQGLREYFRHGKPLAATEFGCCTYRDAAARGGLGWTIVDQNADPPHLDGDYIRDEDEQAHYLRQQLDVFNEEGVDTAFWFTFASYQYPHHEDPHFDLDMAAYGVCKITPDGNLAPKRSFHAMAEAYQDAAGEFEESLVEVDAYLVAVFGVEAGELNAGCVAVLRVGGSDEQIDQQAVLVHQEISLPAVDVLVRVVSARRARHGHRTFDGLGVHHHPDQPGAAPSAQSQPSAQLVVDLLEGSGLRPAGEVAEAGAPRDSESLINWAAITLRTRRIARRSSRSSGQPASREAKRD